MKKSASNDKAQAKKRNDKAAQLLRSLDDAALAAVAGGACRTCGIMVSLDKTVKAGN